VPYLYHRLNAFGDSITAGTGASTEANRWVVRLAQYKGLPLLNNGISGTVLQNSTSLSGSPLASNGRDRYQSALLTGINLSSNYVIAYGLNDLRYNQSVTAPSEFSVANYINDYREIIQGLIAAGVSPVNICLVTPYWIPDAGYSTGSAGFTGSTRIVHESYVSGVIALAVEMGCTCRDVYTAMKSHADPASLIGADNIHPNDVGHEFIFQTVSDIPTEAPHSTPQPVSIAQRTAVLVDSGGNYNSNDSSTSFNGVGLLSGQFTVGAEEVWIEGVFNDTTTSTHIFTFGTVGGTPATSGNVYLAYLMPAGQIYRAYGGAGSSSASYTIPTSGANVKFRLKCGVDGIVVIQTSTDSVFWVTRYTFGPAASGTYYARIYTNLRTAYQVKSAGIPSFEAPGQSQMFNKNCLVSIGIGIGL
jgi:lysophospholipase L1-like esterase